jgi:hypothetical protein
LVENEKNSENRISLDDAKNHLASFGNQIQEYLGKIGANIENYKFSIEKTKDGLAVDVAFRAILKSTNTAETTK